MYAQDKEKGEGFSTDFQTQRVLFTVTFRDTMSSKLNRHKNMHNIAPGKLNLNAFAFIQFYPSINSSYVKTSTVTKRKEKKN